MTRLRLVLPAFVAVLALAAAGCGGSSTKASSSGSIPASASLVPPGAPVYAFANTDFGGDQWSQLNSLLAKFPDKDLLTGMLRQQLSKQGIDWDKDVKPALGPDTGAAYLALAGTSKAMVLTQPEDAAKLDALIAKLHKTSSSSTPTVKREIDGWTVVADSNATLDRAATASTGDSLADNQDFKDAMAALPDDALFKVYVDGTALKKAVATNSSGVNGAAIAGLGSLKSMVASAQATDAGIEAQAVTVGMSSTKAYAPELLASVPSGALVYVSFNDLGAQLRTLLANPQLRPYLGQFETALGVTPVELASVLSGEGALYVRPGSPLPEVTLVLIQSDPQAALATVDKIAERAAASLGTKVESTTIGGVAVKRLSIQGIPIYYGVADDRLIITNSPAGITGVSGPNDKLADDPVFREAKEASGLPDQTTGMVYVNIKDTVPLIDSFAALSGQSLPPRATSNLEHVRTFMAYGTQSGDTSTFKAFLEIK